MTMNINENIVLIATRATCDLAAEALNYYLIRESASRIKWANGYGWINDPEAEREAEARLERVSNFLCISNDF